MEKEITYTIHDGFDHIVDESNNSFIALRKLSWGDSANVKLDIRKWYSGKDGVEKVGKGVSFLTDEGPHELTRALVENGYGYTKEILNAIKDRPDFNTALSSLGKDTAIDIEIDDEDVTEYYDPKELIL